MAFFHRYNRKREKLGKGWKRCGTASRCGEMLYDTMRCNRSDRFLELRNEDPIFEKKDLDWVRKDRVVIHDCGKNKAWNVRIPDVFMRSCAMDNIKIKKIIGTGIAAAGITAAGAVSHAVTKELVKIAVDRDFSYKAPARVRKLFTGSADNADFIRSVNEAAERLESRESVTVEITAGDGERLVGHWFACENAKRTVIAMHGWRASWSGNFGLISDFLHNQGCSVLYAEQRGQGNSGGAYMGLGALERFDCLDWINWVSTNTERLPIYLMGVSMGATTVLMASGLELPGNVHGIIADCGFTSPEEIGRHIVKNNLHIPFHHRENAADEICRKRNQVGIKSCSAVDALRGSGVPVLFIHGADDHFVPTAMTYENYEACSAPKELLIVPGAGHAMSYYKDRQRYEAYVLNFWEKYDERLKKTALPEGLF